MFFLSTALVLMAAPLTAQAAEGWDVEGSLGASLGTTENVFAAPSNETSDTVYGLSADLSLSTESEGGSFSLFGDVDLTRYADTPDEDANDYTIGAKGKIKFDGGSLFGGVKHALDTESRGSVVTRRDSKEPAESTVDNFYAGFRTSLGGMSLMAKAAYTTSDYEDLRHRITNVLIDQDFRDRGTWTETLRLGGDVDGGVGWFFQTTFTQVDYDQAPPAVLHNRDSDGYSAVIGASYDITDSLTGEVSVGWGGRSFDDAGFDDVSDLVVDADLTWMVSPATKVVFAAARDFRESTVNFSPIYISTAVGVRWSHKISDSFTVAAYVEEEWDDHEQRDRQDTTGKAGVSLAYAITESASVTGAYDFTTQDSDGVHAIPGYDDGRLTLGVSLGF
jgi:hypothetical protein